MTRDEMIAKLGAARDAIDYHSGGAFDNIDAVIAALAMVPPADPPSLVALHAAWRTSSDVLDDLNDVGGGEDVEAFGVACDRVAEALDSLLGWTPEETP